MIWLFTLLGILFVAAIALVDRLIPVRKEKPYQQYESWKNWDPWTDR